MKLGKKVFYLLFLLSLTVLGLRADDCCNDCCDDCSNNYYIKLGTGTSFSRKSNIRAPEEVWDPAVEGYKDNFGNSAFVNVGLGYEFCRYFAADIMFSCKPDFKYRKFQHSAGEDPGILERRTRRFDLDVNSLMFSVYLNGLISDCLCWNLDCCSASIYPIIGAGIGVSRLEIYNFRSTGLPIDPAVDPDLLRFASANEYVVRYGFTYQALIGLEYKYDDCWALSLGYRWFDVHKVKGPRYITDESGNGFDVGSGKEWRIPFSANEFLLEFKLYL